MKLSKNINQWSPLRCRWRNRNRPSYSLNELTSNDDEEGFEIKHRTTSSEEEGCKGSRSEFIKRKREDESLTNICKLVKERRNSFEVEDELLLHSEWVYREEIKQVLLPSNKREFVLKTAHEIQLAGHLGKKKTSTHFFG